MSEQGHYICMTCECRFTEHKDVDKCPVCTSKKTQYYCRVCHDVYTTADPGNGCPTCGAYKYAAIIPRGDRPALFERLRAALEEAIEITKELDK